MLEELLKRPIIPVIVIENADDAEPLAEALLEGGMDVAEVTFRTAAAAEAIGRIAKRFPEMLLGAGTVLTVEQANRAMAAGATFGVAPGLNPHIVEHYREADELFIPGVMTPSDIEQGMAFDCKLLKFFPAGAAGGVKMLQALAGPYASSGVQFCPTGGISGGACRFDRRFSLFPAAIPIRFRNKVSRCLWNVLTTRMHLFVVFQ